MSNQLRPTGILAELCGRCDAAGARITAAATCYLADPISYTVCGPRGTVAKLWAEWDSEDYVNGGGFMGFVKRHNDASTVTETPNTPATTDERFLRVVE